MTGNGDEHVLTMSRRVEIHKENIKNYKFSRMLALVCIILNVIGVVANTFLLVGEVQGQNFIWGGVYSRVAIIALNLLAIAVFSHTVYNNSRLIKMNQESIDYLENN